MSTFRIIVAIAVAALGLIIVRVHGAGDASLHGRVADARGKLIRGASVVLRAGPAVMPVMTQSGGDGTYTFSHLQPGIDYEFTGRA